MSLNKVLYAALWVGFVLWTTQAQAADVRVGLYQFQPFFETDKEGNHRGVWLDILKKALAKLDKTATFEAFPPPRLVKNIIEGRNHLTISASHVAVDGHVYYSDEPVDVISLNAYRKKDRPAFTSIEGLAGKSVIVIRGYAYNGRINALRDPKNEITLIEAGSHYEALRRLQNSSADYMLDYENPVNNAFETAGVDPDSIERDEISSYPVYFVVSKKLINASDVIGQLNDFLRDVKKQNKS